MFEARLIRKAIFGEPQKPAPILRPEEIIYPHAKTDFSEGVNGIGHLDLHNAIVRRALKFGDSIDVNVPKGNGETQTRTFTFIRVGARVDLVNARIPHVFLDRQARINSIAPIVIPNGAEWTFSKPVHDLRQEEIKRLYRYLNSIQTGRNK